MWGLLSYAQPAGLHHHLLAHIPAATQLALELHTVPAHVQIFHAKHATRANRAPTERYVSGNSLFFRMNRILDIYFVGGFGTVQVKQPGCGGISGGACAGGMSCDFRWWGGSALCRSRCCVSVGCLA